MTSRVLACLLASTILVAAKELSLKARSHNTGPEWIMHCWDHAPNHIMDPFCAFLNNNCSTAPTVDHGNHSKNYNVTIGSTVSYFCNDGYYLTGPEVVTCEKTGTIPKWSQTPICQKATCSAIPDIDNGYHENTNSTAIGTTVRYFCNDGYDILDKDTISCVLNGTGKVPAWTPPVPECIGVCAPPLFTNGVILLPGMAITTASTDTAIETTTERQYATTSVPDVYNVSMTTRVPDTFNATVATSLSDNSNGTTAMPDTLDANSTLLDIHNDTTENLADAANGTVVMTTDISKDTTTATTMPDTNEIRSDALDNSNLTTTVVPDVYNGTSTGIQVLTNKVTAVLPDTTTLPLSTTNTISPYVYITNKTFRINDTIIYMCNPGYGIVSTAHPGYAGNTMEATCRLTTNETDPTADELANWSTTVSCVRECPPVIDVLNANYTTPSNTFEGAIVLYTCFSGFIMVGPSDVKCLPTGNWSELPSCLGCMAPPEIKHGTHDTDYNTTIDSVVSYVCGDGYNMFGLDVVKCKVFPKSPYARWTAPPACIRGSIGSEMSLFGSEYFVCPQLGNTSPRPKCKPVCATPAIPNSELYRNLSYESDMVEVVCEESYTLIGNDILECSKGNWSTPLPYCQCTIKPVDIVFIIDGSGSLGVQGFSQTLQFVVDMVSRFPTDTTRFGLLTFSTGVYLQFHLNKYVNNTVGLIENIRNTAYPTGGTHTYAALEYARTEMFQERNGMRPNVSHIAIVVTDGKSGNFNRTVDQAELLKNSGVTVYSVGIGLTDENELQLIASNTTYVFTVDNYDKINDIADAIVEATCASTKEDFAP